MPDPPSEASAEPPPLRGEKQPPPLASGRYPPLKVRPLPTYGGHYMNFYTV